MLPPLYSRWTESLLRRTVSSEPAATCHECPLCATAEKTELDVKFNVDTKCCTYHPHIPNFLAGDLILDTTPHLARGRALFLERFDAPAVIRPDGVYPSLAEGASDSLWNPGFGKDTSALCPYYQQDTGGLCGIWTHRNARCSTWFCKHERGQTGRNFWRSLKEWLATAENQLSLWCIHRLEVGSESYRELFPIQGPLSLAQFQMQQDFNYRIALPADMISQETRLQMQNDMWGGWLDRRQDFYCECSALVNAMDCDDVAAIGGEKLARYIHQLQYSSDQLLSREMPQRLKACGFRSVPLKNGNTRVWGYSNYDPLDLPQVAVEAVPYFDGRETEAAIERIRAELNYVMTADVLLTLYDFGLLAPAD